MRPFPPISRSFEEMLEAMKHRFKSGGIPWNKGRHKTFADYPSPIRDEQTGCLRWQGPKHRHGYGKFKQTFIHRFVWEQSNGPIPKGMEIDHVRARGCIHKDCFEVSHLELVTHTENVSRRSVEDIQALGKIQANKTHCPYGHEYTDRNTMRLGPKKARNCRRCRQQRLNQYRAKKKSEGFIRSRDGGWKQCDACTS